MKIENIDGILWVEPNHIKIGDLIERLKQNESVEAVKAALGIINNNHWNTIAEAIFAEWKRGADHPEGNDILVSDINSALAQNALVFPVYGTAVEAQAIKEMLFRDEPDLAGASKLIFHVVMQPRIRALQLVGRFNKIPLFAEFSYFIESATISYYRGNVASAFLSILPVVEGILLRWQGFPGILAKRPDFQKIKKFIGNSIYRQPIPHMPAFLESYVQAADKICKNHLYKNTTDGGAHDDFNRHLALHMLEDRNFYSHENVMRAFLLVDLLSEIYICEKRIFDPRWSTERSEDLPHEDAYIKALMQQQARGAPERILFTHSQHVAAESIGI